MLIEVGERCLPLAQDAERDRGPARRDRRAAVPLDLRGEALVEPRRKRRVHSDDLVDERMGQLMPHDREVLVVRHVLEIDDDRALARQRDTAVRRGKESGVRAPDAEDRLEPEREACAAGECVHRGPARE